MRTEVWAIVDNRKAGKNAAERGELQRGVIARHAADRGTEYSYKKWHAEQKKRKGF